MKILVSGIGRSGTTALFSLFADSMKQCCSEVSFFYEPYLWDVREVNKTGDIDAGRFDYRNISTKGMYVHVETPLFSARGNFLHDGFVNDILESSENVLVKVIRGNGRLESFLEKDSNLIVVGVIRNVFDTINSSLNHFPLLGDDFHRSDKFRFQNDVFNYFSESIKDKRLNNHGDEVAWSAYWWLYMTKALVMLKKKYPKRVVLLDYDYFAKDKYSAVKDIEEYVRMDISKNIKNNKPLGLVTKKKYINNQVVNYLSNFHSFYRNNICVDKNLICFDDKFVSDVDYYLNKYNNSDIGVVLKYPTMRTSVGWRFYASSKDSDLYDSINVNKSLLETIQKSLYFRCGQEVQAGDENRIMKKNSPKVSVVIPFFNAKDSIDAAVKSVLSQSYSNIEVVLVDDASNDGGGDYAKFWTKYPNVKLVTNSHNVGPGLSRHRGVLAATGEYITTLDVDDICFYDKIYSEMSALDGRKDCIAFSDVAYIQNSNFKVWRFEDFDGLNKIEKIKYIVSRSSYIPRDFIFSKEMYYKTEGFEPVVRMYEDWSFKIRMATKVNKWIYTNELGMVYNRVNDGLSDKPRDEHVFFLYFNFFNNIDELIVVLDKNILLIFVDALKKFGESEGDYAGLLEILKRYTNKNELIDILLNLKRKIFMYAFDSELSWREKILKINQGLL